jgi:hypothetical protein
MSKKSDIQSNGEVIDNETGEVLNEAGGVAVAVAASNLPGFNLPGFTVARVVTVPTLSLEIPRGQNEIHFAVQIVSEMWEGKETTTKRKDKNGDEVGTFTSKADLVKVRDLLDGGVEKIMVVPKVLCGQLNENYPDNGFVGRYFAIRKYTKDGKNYGLFDMIEVKPNT